MPDTWVAVDAGIDPVSWARLLRRAHDRAHLHDGGDERSASRIVRPVIRASWERSEAAGVDVDGRPPLMWDGDQVDRTMQRHPLGALQPLVSSILVRVAEYAHQTVILADSEGHILWTAGDPDTREAAARINLVPGALWSEEACGTNAIGTAIALDHPVQVFSAEHFKRLLHSWSCAAAPICDVETGARLGVVALAGSFKNAHPHGFSLVVATAQIVQANQQHQSSERDERIKVEYLEKVLSGCERDSAVVNRAGRVLLSSPPGWLGARLRMDDDGMPVPPAADDVTIEKTPRGSGFLVYRNSGNGGMESRPVLRIEALGRERAVGHLGRRSFDFTPRHSEILVILAAHPAGLSEQALAEALYGSRRKNVTIRAEISRLRRLLGPVICTRPYRLVADVGADFMDALAAVERGDAAPGLPLLPSSVAPGITELRARLSPTDGATAQN